MTKNLKNNNNFKFLEILKNHILNYPVPSNLTIFYNFGFLSGVCLMIQIITGIFLTMHYIPHVDLAFDSIEMHIMREVNNGWYIRYVHSNGASLFFVCLYIHLARGLYYRSYIFPRYLVWTSGLIIFILTMLTAFLGYVLPWGQMSYWGATVITSLFSAVPLCGQDIVYWLWGGYSINNATLPRFYAIHFFTPFLILGFVFLHLKFLHDTGSSNPLVSDNTVDTIKFYPYYILKDFTSFFILIWFLTFLVHFEPNLLNHPDNYNKSTPFVTPRHIVPEWYFLPFYAILRSIPNKLYGVLLMFFSIVILFFLPFIKFFIRKNYIFFLAPRFRFIFRKFYWLFISNFFVLGWIGGKPVEYPFVEIGKWCTFFYFFYFLILIPLIEWLEDAIHMQIVRNLCITLKKTKLKPKKNQLIVATRVNLSGKSSKIS